MAKHQRFKPQPEPPDAGQLSPVTGELLARAGRHLERMLALVEGAAAEGNVSPAMVRESTGVARAIAAVSAEERARLKSALSRIDEISAEDVLAFARRLDSTARAQLRRRIEDLDRGSVLA